MSISYLVLGSGRQGTAAAYDLARFGDAGRLILADMDLAQAQQAAQQVDRLTGAARAEPLALDARDPAAVETALRGLAGAGPVVLVSAVPYYFNLALTRAAIAAGAHMVDLGGHTGIVREQHALHPQAQAAGVSVVPDCGMGPGMGVSLAVYAMSLLDEPRHVYVYDGGLPQEPLPPWNYQASFSIEGLTNEYAGNLTILRDGALLDLPAFSELETIEHPALGPLEAFVAAGGLSTAPWTFQGRLQTLQLKILRYPGTYAGLKAFSDLGLFDLEPVLVDGSFVVPRHLFHALYEPRVRAAELRDVCLIRVIARGVRAGSPAAVTIDLVDRADPVTGFSSMERCTGWHAAIVAAMAGRAELPAGITPLELAVPGEAFVREARRRGFVITEEIAQEHKDYA